MPEQNSSQPAPQTHPDSRVGVSGPTLPKEQQQVPGVNSQQLPPNVEPAPQPGQPDVHPHFGKQPPRGQTSDRP